MSFPTPFSPVPQSASLGQLRAGLAYVHGSVARFDGSQISAISRHLTASDGTLPDLELRASQVGPAYSLGAERLLRRPQLDYVMGVNKVARLRPVGVAPHFANPLAQAILDRLRRIKQAPRSQAADVPKQSPNVPTLPSEEMTSRLASLLEEPDPKLAIDRAQAIALTDLLEGQETAQRRIFKLKYDLFQVCDERQKDALITYLVQTHPPQFLTAGELLRDLR